MTVEYIPYKKIDKKKWDRCVKNSMNSLIYGQSFYLDNTAENWDGLVLNDYEAVMPLTWKKKWQITYLYQPAFIQQGGIFFQKKLSIQTINFFFKKMREHFRFAECTLNYANAFFPDSIEVVERNNYIISLDKKYKETYINYHPNFTKSLRRLKKLDLQYTVSSDFVSTLELYKKLYSKRLNIADDAINRFGIICDIFSKKDNLIIRSAYSADKNLLAVTLLLKDERRLYNMISCITEEGKKKEANYFLYDRIIEEFSNTALLLDMEGSDRKGIETFYKKLNPLNEPYPFIKYNELPSLVKLFKK